MGTLYLVRHGQASLGAEDYDHLSPLGQQQSVRLGEYFRQKGLHFETVLTGTLCRQVQTYAGICEGMNCGAVLPAAGAELSFAAGPPQGETAPSGGQRSTRSGKRGGVTAVARTQ